MTELIIDMSEIVTPEAFYAAFFASSAGLVPDYGGRNLDALLDDLGDVEQSVTLVLEGCERAVALDRWLDRLLGTLAHSIGRSGGLITVLLRAAPI